MVDDSVFVHLLTMCAVSKLYFLVMLACQRIVLSHLISYYDWGWISITKLLYLVSPLEMQRTGELWVLHKVSRHHSFKSNGEIR